jgi:UDP-N-acetyl-D-glucosamine dehydrogenase
MTQPHVSPASLPQPGTEVEEAQFDYDVAVVGLGHVGLPTALAYHAGGARVVAVDPSADRLVEIGAGLVDLISSDRDRLSVAITDDRFQLTADPAAVSRSHAVIVCVPTTVDSYFVPDLTALRDACTTVMEHAVAGQVLVLTSTTYVGCTEDLLVKPLARAGFHVGEDIFVAFSAALMDPGSEAVAQEIMPRVVGGATAACLDRAARTLAGYARYVHRVPSLATAETTKLLEHTFRTVNIALADEFTGVSRSLDINVMHETASNSLSGSLDPVPR